MMDKILLVDDERDIVVLLEEVLNREGFRNIKKAYTGQDALVVCREFQPDVIVLDIMLPDIDGIEVCKQIRSFSYCSILFLSSKSDDVDKILGLASGGDDYVTKPFSPKEIVYRIKSQLRRMQYARDDVMVQKSITLHTGDITIDTDACCVYKDGQLLELTAKEYGILQFMMENQNKIISKERLYERIWGEESAVCDNTIMVHIRHLREKIEDDSSDPKRLKTVKGLGYKLIGGEE
ncbi:Transcriptional regulatory protein WalR [bioreactor metagenome]|uniref:Transcriptional regulatory protein WalR n=1 Tax=bioreactor metagenome TaxID=1076179 RepID=A0A645DZ53_9ZZZZ|nr:response regulator transcription factor [Candidatus Metalachnospira sp.]